MDEIGKYETAVLKMLEETMCHAEDGTKQFQVNRVYFS